jgi:hypothetical protein
MLEIVGLRKGSGFILQARALEGFVKTFINAFSF